VPHSLIRLFYVVVHTLSGSHNFTGGYRMRKPCRQLPWLPWLLLLDADLAAYPCTCTPLVCNMTSGDSR
jgi:hypothetical protein